MRVHMGSNTFVLGPGEPLPILSLVYRWEYSKKPAYWYYPKERDRGIPDLPENQRKRWWARPRSSPPLLPDVWWPPYEMAPVCVVWEATPTTQWERRALRDIRKAIQQRNAIEVAQTRRPSGLRCEMVVWVEMPPVENARQIEALVESFGPHFDQGRKKESGPALRGLAAIHAEDNALFLGTVEARNVKGLRDQWRRHAKRWLAGRDEENIRCGLVYVRAGAQGELRPLEPPDSGAIRCPRCLNLMEVQRSRKSP